MRPHITLHTERLILRPWRASDREPFARLTADPEVMRFFPATLTREESDAMVARIAQHFAEHGWGPWVAEERSSTAFLGFVGLFNTTFEAAFTPCVEILWRLVPTAWGRGYASEGARECLRFAFEELALDEVVSFAVEANVRSRRVMERVGMQRDLAGDFEHPRVPERHPLRRHVLHRLRKEAWKPPFE